MTELLICSAALLLIFISAQLGAKSGGASALSWALASILAVLVTMRYWFLLSRCATENALASLPVAASLCFWGPFLVIVFVIMRLCETHLEQFASVAPSFVGRILGLLFGATAGAVFASALILTLGILVPQCFSKPSNLPVPIHEMPILAFRWIETNVAGVSQGDPAHTPLPHFKETSSGSPLFWR